jgi:hypothetical protein
VRRGNALLALKRYADADAAADRALSMDPSSLAKQVAQLKKKCAKKMSAAAGTETKKKKKKKKKNQLHADVAMGTGGKGTADRAVAAPEDVHSFAKRLVTAAMNCGACDPAKSKFEGAHLHLSLLSSGEEKRLHVTDLYAKYTEIADAPGRARFIMSVIRTELVGHAVLPATFDIAKHLLRPRLFSRQKIDGPGGVASGMPEGDALPCWMVGDGRSQGKAGECTVASSIVDVDDVAVAVVVDYGPDGGMLPVLASTCKAWGVDFAKDVRRHAIANLEAETVTSQPAEWKPHMSGCLTSPWTDNVDGVRLALFPETFVPAISPMQGAPPRPASAGPAPVVCIFGTNNCVLASDPCNPISLCFSADIALNDMSKTADFVSAAPYRLVRTNKGSGGAQPWAWRRYSPNLSAAEFSVPTAQSEIDQILDAVQSGGKKQIPVFGDTESSQESRKKNVVALLNAAKSDAATQEKIKSKMEKTKKEKVAGGAAPAGGKTRLKTGFLDGNGPGLKENRSSEAQKRRAAAAKGAANVDFSTMKSGFFAGEKKEDFEVHGDTPIFEEAGQLVEAAATFAGAKEGLLFKMGPAGTGYYKDDLVERIAQAKTKATENKKNRKPRSAADENLKKAMFKSETPAPAMIDLATLNSAIGSYGSLGGMNGGFGSSGGTGMRSLFSL